MNSVLSRKRIGVILFSLIAAGAACGLNACKAVDTQLQPSFRSSGPVLEAMGASWGPNLEFEKSFLQAFGVRNRIKTQFVPNTRLGTYQELLRNHSPEPDLLEIDVVWPAILADDLVDLSPYVKDQAAFVPQLLEPYKVGGRLVALPIYVDMGVLYYRPELLKKYDFKGPPDSWNELEQMASRIQAGERGGSNKHFWGYVWNGAVNEGGTCDALELQSSAGAGNFIEPGGINVQSPIFAKALRRETHWIGTISPPAEYVYDEQDAENVWDAGQTAFMRNWVSGYGLVAARPGGDQQHFAIAPLPAGPGGHKGTLGGMGMGVSKYAANRELAIKALLQITNEANTLQRLYAAEAAPTRTALLQRSDVRSRSQLMAVSAQLMTTLVARPSVLVGDKYEAVSRSYAKAVNSVLRREDTPEVAMEKLARELHRETGLGSLH